MMILIYSRETALSGTGMTAEVCQAGGFHSVKGRRAYNVSCPTGFHGIPWDLAGFHGPREGRHSKSRGKSWSLYVADQLCFRG